MAKASASAADTEALAAPARLGQRGLSCLLVLLACQVALVASHGGEFWPFSTFPMFASAGRPWQRALTLSVDEALLHGALRASYALESLPSEPFPLLAHGIPQNDLSSLVQRAESWSQSEQHAFGQLFAGLPCSALPLLVLRVRGSLANAAVEKVAIPLATVSCEAGQQRIGMLLPPGSSRNIDANLPRP